MSASPYARAKPALADLALALWQANRPEPLQPTLAIIAASVERSERETRRRHRCDAIVKGKNVADHEGSTSTRSQKRAARWRSCSRPGVAVSQHARRARDDLRRGQGGRSTGRKTISRTCWKSRSAGTSSRPRLSRRSRSSDEACFDADRGGPTRCRRRRLRHVPAVAALRLEPDFLAGHSYGEYAALCAAGALAEHDLIRLSHERGMIIVEAVRRPPAAWSLSMPLPISWNAYCRSGRGDGRQQERAAPDRDLRDRGGNRSGAAKAKEQGIQQSENRRLSRFPLATRWRALGEPLARALAQFRFATLQMPGVLEHHRSDLPERSVSNFCAARTTSSFPRSSSTRKFARCTRPGPESLLKKDRKAFSTGRTWSRS